MKLIIIDKITTTTGCVLLRMKADKCRYNSTLALASTLTKKFSNSTVSFCADVMEKRMSSLRRSFSFRSLLHKPIDKQNVHESFKTSRRSNPKEKQTLRESYSTSSLRSSTSSLRSSTSSLRKPTEKNFKEKLVRSSLRRKAATGELDYFPHPKG